MSEELRHVQDNDWVRLRQTVARLVIDLKTGQERHPVVNVTGASIEAEAGKVYVADTTGGTVTINLPNAAAAVDRMVVAKKADSSANAIVLNPVFGETIDGGATASTNIAWGSLWAISDGTAWYTL